MPQTELFDCQRRLQDAELRANMALELVDREQARAVMYINKYDALLKDMHTLEAERDEACRIHDALLDACASSLCAAGLCPARARCLANQPTDAGQSGCAATLRAWASACNSSQG